MLPSVLGSSSSRHELRKLKWLMYQREKKLPTFCPDFDFYNKDGGSLFQKENSSFMLVLSERVLLRMMIKQSNFMTVQFNL